MTPSGEGVMEWADARARALVSQLEERDCDLHPADRAFLIAAVAFDLTDCAKQAFLAGWDITGEGYNAEWPAEAEPLDHWDQWRPQHDA